MRVFVIRCHLEAEFSRVRPSLWTNAYSSLPRLSRCIEDYVGQFFFRAALATRKTVREGLASLAALLGTWINLRARARVSGEWGMGPVSNKVRFTGNR